MFKFSPAKLVAGRSTASVVRSAAISHYSTGGGNSASSEARGADTKHLRPASWQTQSKTTPTRMTWRPFENKTFFRPFELGRNARRAVGKTRTPRDTYPMDTSQLRYKDPFKQLGIDPRHEFENVRLMSDFVTTLGKIKPRGETKLTMKSQRVMSKAIKRAKHMGLIPLHSKRGWIAKASFNLDSSRRNNKKHQR